MKHKIKYSEEPLGILKVIRDFLPPPERLVLKEEQVKDHNSSQNDTDV
jgi:hypothetical protein